MTDWEKQYQEQIAKGIVPSAEKAGALATIAGELRGQDRHLGAAICSLAGHRAAWGVDPQELCPQLLVDSINDLLQFLGNDTQENWNTLLAYQLLAQNCTGIFFSGDTVLQLAKIKESAQTGYYRLLSELAKGHPSADALLVSGFQLKGCLDEQWMPVFPGYEVLAGGSSISRDGSTHTIGMDSGFRVLLSLGDFDGATQVSQTRMEALVTPGLRGWSIASSALLDGDATGFANASAQFSLDAQDRAGREEPSWSGINQQLWAPYFMSRSYMAAPYDSPEEALENVRKACSPDQLQSHWLVPRVNRYYQIINAVRGFADGDISTVNSAVQLYQSDARLALPSSFDSHVMDFLSHLQTLSNMLAGDGWVDPLSQIVRLLDRMPIFTAPEIGSIKSVLDLRLPTSLLGLKQGWEYQALASITDEPQLHRILLALFRAEAEVPLFSQIRHGPLEYGKDIVVSREDNGRQILRMYSVKTGEIKKPAWNSDIRPQLEEMFQVPLNSPEIPDGIDEIIVILVWNDHINPYVEPLIKGWLTQQLDTLGHKYELMNIDRLVKYVTENRLGAVLREALRNEKLMD